MLWISPAVPIGSHVAVGSHCRHVTGAPAASCCCAMEPKPHPAARHEAITTMTTNAIPTGDAPRSGSGT